MELKWAVAAVTGILLAVLCICLAVVFIKWLYSLDRTSESASRSAGRHGEVIAAEIIRRVFREGDHLLTNIEITYDGRQAEMDCVVVNKFGVFFFEVSNQAVKKTGLSAGALFSAPSDQSMGGRVCYFTPSKQPCGQ